MIKGNATLVVDLGNSSTKCVVLYGKDSATNKMKERRFDLSNQFAQVSGDYKLPEDYSEKTSSVVKVNAKVGGAQVAGTYCNGEVQRKEYPTGALRPTATRKKYDLDTTALSYTLALLHAHKTVASMSGTTDLSSLDITWNVVTLLPPADLDNGKDKIESIIKSIKVIESSTPSCKLKVSINKVAVFPEGYCAYGGVVFDRGRVFRPESKFLQEENVIVFDVGAGTTDCLLVKEGKLVQSTKHTVNKGGNNVYQLVKRALELEDLYLDESELQQGIITGLVRDGAKKVSIVEHINKAKSDVANIIIEDFSGYLERTDIKVRSVGYILVCGGGSMNTEGNEEIKALSDSLVENFKKMAPNTELVEVPERESLVLQEDDSYAKIKKKISPRDLNLVGASIFAEAIM